MVGTIVKFVIQETAIAALINMSINAGYTYWLWRSHPYLSVSGEFPIGYDLALTPFFIGLLATWFGTAGLRKRAPRDLLMAHAVSLSDIFGALPYGVLIKGGLIGTAAAGIFGVPLWLMLPLFGDGVISIVDACLLKTVITLALSVVLVPVVALSAVADVNRVRSA
jgi:hypothetical protein